MQVELCAWLTWKSLWHHPVDLPPKGGVLDIQCESFTGQAEHLKIKGAVGRCSHIVRMFPLHGVSPNTLSWGHQCIFDMVVLLSRAAMYNFAIVVITKSARLLGVFKCTSTWTWRGKHKMAAVFGSTAGHCSHVVSLLCLAHQPHPPSPPMLGPVETWHLKTRDSIWDSRNCWSQKDCLYLFGQKDLKQTILITYTIILIKVFWNHWKYVENSTAESTRAFSESWDKNQPTKTISCLMFLFWDQILKQPASWNHIILWNNMIMITDNMISFL